MIKYIFSFVFFICLIGTTPVYALAPWNLGTEKTGIHSKKARTHAKLHQQLLDIADSIEKNHKNSGMLFEPSKPQLISNEPDRDKLINLLQEQALDDNRRQCHVGVSGFFNYDMMAARKSGFGILLDINPNVIKVHNIAINLLKDMGIANRHDFMREFMTKMRSNSVELMVFDLRLFQQLEKQTSLPYTWLGSDEAFEHIRLLAIADRIITIQLSISNAQSLKQIADTIHANGFRVDTLYTSNVIHWILQTSLQKDLEPEKLRFAMGLLPLIDESSLYISSDNRLSWGFKLGINSDKNDTFPFLLHGLKIHQSA